MLVDSCFVVVGSPEMTLPQCLIFRSSGSAYSMLSQAPSPSLVGSLPRSHCPRKSRAWSWYPRHTSSVTSRPIVVVPEVVTVLRVWYGGEGEDPGGVSGGVPGYFIAVRVWWVVVWVGEWWMTWLLLLGVAGISLRGSCTSCRL